LALAEAFGHIWAFGLKNAIESLGSQSKTIIILSFMTGCLAWGAILGLLMTPVKYEDERSIEHSVVSSFVDDTSLKYATIINNDN
jgi:RsiW-degrading membrane proteinase PrsW (M82 family)